MGASGRTETTGKRKTSLRKWCFLLTITFAIVLILFYSLQIKPDNTILKENITNFDEEKFQVIKRMLENLKKERGEQITWRKSPVNVPESHIVNDVFNWTMSFRPSSDIFRPYGFYYPVDKNYERPESLLEFLESKDLLAVWLASHCGLLRDKYIRRLKQFMNIDVYGKCGSGVGGTSGKCIQDSPDCKKHLKRYKFFFAFENSFCTDYITEKYWFSLMLGVVPVVLGGASYDETVAIPGSYINAMNFTSIKALAEYLKRLDNNDKEYNKFFEWRNKYKVVASAPWACQLCAALHIDQKPKVQDHLDVFWGRYQQCGRKEDFIKKVINEQPLTPIKHKYSGR
ncbi:predicted protein [Nematostella vectensis]|uniref:Fucosyltransferase n=1 Tax=Nematostella vectensis TaxID=45351 RepID=A7S634_NEMVE|nr:predicted protein [Nematostella vectensis]|eukprot:XP_001632933.1 predicted protein [Nematostella vectensis]